MAVWQDAVVQMLLQATHVTCRLSTRFVRIGESLVRGSLSGVAGRCFIIEFPGRGASRHLA